MSGGDIDYPVKGWLLGEPLPDLDRLPRARWREVLAPLSSRARDWTIRRVAPENIVAAVGSTSSWRERTRSAERPCGA